MIDLTEKEIFISSDFHFDHKNICRGVSAWKNTNGTIAINRTRDFKDLNEMNDTLVNNINNTVGQEDVLIFLGDWSFNGAENVKKFRDRIICQNIYFVLGNHDKHIHANKDLFLNVSHEMELIVSDSKIILNFHPIDDNANITFSHYPVASWKNLNKGAIMLHGHLHSSNKDKFVGDGKIMDCGIDGHPDFRPYNLKTEILPIMNKRPIASLITKDRHGKI